MSTVVIILIALVVFYVISIYNSLQTLKTQIVAAVQEIGNQLKRQAMLIPGLMSSVKGYLKHEKSIFKMLTDSRKAAEKAERSGKTNDIEKAVSSLQSVIPQIQVAVEDNPELKSDVTVTKFMNELTDTADKLSYARRSVIDLTQTYNQKLVVFPSNLIAGALGFKPEKGLETPLSGSHLAVNQKEMEDVPVDFNT